MTADADILTTPPGASAQHVSRSRELTLLLLIITVAAGLRLWRLDSIPPGINQDEAVHAYDAWSLLKTGRDHDGARWPIFFRAFGDYHPGPFVYAIIPFEAIWGLNVIAARMPAALIGIAAIPLAYCLLRKRYGETVGLLAAAMLAISPWHVHLSRLAFEAGTCPTLLLLGFVLLQSAHPMRAASHEQTNRAKQLVLLLAAGLVFGLTTWTYHAMRAVVPMLLLVVLVFYRAPIRKAFNAPGTRLNFISFLGGLLVGLTPFLAASILAPEQAWARAAAVVGGAQNESVDSTLTGWGRNYLAHFSPTFLFLQGDQSEIQSLPGFGQMHLFGMLFLPMGIIHILTHRGDRFGRLLLMWMLIGPLPAALTHWNGGHALRSVGMLPPVEIISAFGAAQLLAFARGRSRFSLRWTRLGMVAVMLIATGHFCWRFFGQYPIRSAPAFQAEWALAFADIREKESDYDLVLLSPDRSNQLGMLYLFWTKMDPAKYQNCDKEIEQLIGIERIVRIGKVVFRPSAYLPILGPQLPPCARLLVVERPDVPVTGVELKRYPLPDGLEALVMYDLSTSDIPNAKPCPSDTPR